MGLSPEERETRIRVAIEALSRGNLGEVLVLKNFVANNEELLKELRIREVKLKMKQILWEYKDSKI